MKLRVEGLEGAVSTLRALQGAFADEKIVALLMAEGAIPLKEEIQMLAPMKTGALLRSIVAKPVGAIIQNQPAVFVAVDMKQIPRDPKRANRYPYIVEYGSDPHTIRPKRGHKMLKIFGRIWVPKVEHPGFEGRRFFRGGLSRMRPVIRMNIEAGLKRLLDRFQNPGTGGVQWGAGKLGE